MGVVQDDHFALVSALSRSAPQCLDVDRSFASARGSYQKAGLTTADHKAKQGIQVGTVVGAEVVGDQACLGSPRTRRWGLVELTSRTLAVGKTSGRLMRKLLATWLHALLFRRPALALLQISFRLLPSISRDDVVYALPHACAVELMYLCALAPSALHGSCCNVGSPLSCHRRLPLRGGCRVSSGPGRPAPRSMASS